MNGIDFVVGMQLPDPGICIMGAAPVIHTGKVFSVKGSLCSIYHVNRSANGNFYAVVYCLIRRVSDSIRKTGRIFRDRVLSLRRGIVQLAYAGGLRL